MDDLLDLNWTSSAPGRPSAPAAGPSSTQWKPASRSPSPAAYSAFDSLASTGSSYAPNYTSSSTQASHLQPKGKPTSVARSPSPNLSVSATRTQQSSSASHDAFDSLFAGTGAKGSSQKASERPMTLQDRMRAQSSGLGFSQASRAAVVQETSGDPWDFDMLSPSTSSKAVEQTQAPIQRQSSPFDIFDDLEATSSSTSKLSLDSGTHIPATGYSHIDADDDILGILGKPVTAAKTSTPPAATQATRQLPDRISSPLPSPSGPSSRPTSARTPSPPPHILGEVVSMGFSVRQARLALAATLGAEKPGKWSVNAAMEILVSDGAAQAARNRENGRSHDIPSDSDREEEDNARQQRRSRIQDTKLEQRPETTRRAQKPKESSSQPALDVTANELLQQASVLGSSMLKSANTYWKTSRAQLQKAIEEKKLAIPSISGPNSGRSSPASAKPRWMAQETDYPEGPQNAERPRDGESDTGARAQNGFKDLDYNEAPEAVLPPHPAERHTNRNQMKRPETTSMPVLVLEQPSAHEQGSTPPSGPHPRNASFLGVTQHERKTYSSPNRRKAATASSAPASAVPPRSPATVQGPTKVLRPPRPLISASPAQLDTSHKRRLAGNEHFKLGRYGDAVNAYTSAIDILPEGHLGRVVTLNNRANARLKNGEERQAAEDATTVLDILCAPTDLKEMTREVWEAILHDFSNGSIVGLKGENLDAHDALGKALSRRAKGYEGCEKWRLAMLDWQMITELGDPAVVKSAGGMRVVSEGLSRCRKVVEGPPLKSPSQRVPKRPLPSKVSRPVQAGVPVNSDALNKLRQTNEKAEAEETERLKVKDAVDAKITEWRGGKENNLRALIASLDNILWDELGWKKVGMHELISDSQLKVRYVRAISKVHPDKLGHDLPVERKLIANAVFGTLSDAWNAHNG